MTAKMWVHPKCNNRRLVKQNIMKIHKDIKSDAAKMLNFIKHVYNMLLYENSKLQHSMCRKATIVKKTCVKSQGKQDRKVISSM